MIIVSEVLSTNSTEQFNIFHTSYNPI